MEMAHEEAKGGIFVERRSAKMAAAGSWAEGIAGIGTITLSILGLANIYPELMLYIATIAAGAAFLFEGGAISARLSSLVRASGAEQVETMQFGMGVTSEFFAGIVGVVLGILALIGIRPLILIPAAAIVFGGVLLLSSGITSRLNSLWASAAEERAIVRDIASEAALAAGSVQILIGLGSLTLGILALIGIYPLTLSLIAILSVGLSDLMSGTTIGSRMSHAFRK